MSSDEHESGATWQDPTNSDRDQYRKMNSPLEEDTLPPLPAQRDDEQQSLSEFAQVQQDDFSTEEQPGILGRGRELLDQSRNYIFILAIPLLFAAFTAILVLPLVATQQAALPPVGFWPVAVIILTVAIAQGVFAYYAEGDIGILAIGTVGGLFLFLLIATFSIFGLLAGVILLFVVLAASIALSRFYIHPVPEGSVDIVYSYGKYNRTLYPGFNVILPWEKIAAQLHVDERQWVCPVQRIQMSRDEEVRVGALVSYQLMPEDAYLAILQDKNWEERLHELFITLLRTSIRHLTPDDLIPWPRNVRSRTTSNGGRSSENTTMRKEHLNDELFEQLRDRVALWGVQVNTVRLGEVELAPHDIPLVDTDKIVGTPTAFDDDETTQLSFNPGVPQSTKTIETAPPVQEMPKDAQGDSATPVAPPSEEVLVKAYKAVQEGKITDPETIRDIAAKFEAVANDPNLSQNVSFDAARAVHNLYVKAQTYDETRSDRPRRVTDENLMAGG